MIKSAPICLCKKKIRIFAAAPPFARAQSRVWKISQRAGAKKAEPGSAGEFRPNGMRIYAALFGGVICGNRYLIVFLGSATFENSRARF